MRDHLAAIRSEVNPKYAARIDKGEIEKQFVNFYFAKFYANHTPESVLTDVEKANIVRSIQNLRVKDEN